MPSRNQVQAVPFAICLFSNKQETRQSKLRWGHINYTYNTNRTFCTKKSGFFTNKSRNGTPRVVPHQYQPVTRDRFFELGVDIDGVIPGVSFHHLFVRKPNSTIEKNTKYRSDLSLTVRPLDHVRVVQHYLHAVIFHVYFLPNHWQKLKTKSTRALTLVVPHNKIYLKSLKPQ